MLQELNFGVYLGFLVFLLFFNQEDNINLVRVLINYIYIGYYFFMFWMWVFLVVLEDLRDDIIENVLIIYIEEYSGEEKMWMWWYNFWILCDYSKRIVVVFEIGVDFLFNYVIDCWFGEFIKVVIFFISIFLINKKGFFVFFKMYQRFIFWFFKLEVQFIIIGINYYLEKEFCFYF